MHREAARAPGARIICLLTICLTLPAVDAYGQYFGRNKVQYEAFDFKVLETQHFDIYYYPQEARAAEMAGRMAERWYARLSRVLDYEMGTRQPLILMRAIHISARRTRCPARSARGPAA